MSAVALGRLTRDVSRDPSLARQIREEPGPLLSAYGLSEDEREAVLDLDARRLVDLGLNPIVMRNLLVAGGVDPWADLYDHPRTLRPPASPA